MITQTMTDSISRVDPARAAQVMLGTITSCVVVITVWAGLAQVPETAVAAGRVAPARALQQVSNLEGGRVTAIVARPGDRVTAGQLLLRLDPDAAAADLGRSSSMTAALKARIVRLEAESSGTAPAFPFPKFIRHRSSATGTRSGICSAKSVRQENNCATAPPSGVPTTMPNPAPRLTQPRTPRRISAGTQTATKPYAAEAIAPPPSPCTKRPAIKIAVFGASQQISAPAAMAASADASMRWNPTRTASLPAGTIATVAATR